MLTKLDSPLVAQFLFHPRREFDPGSGDSQKVSVKVSDTISLGGRIFISSEDAPIIVFFHGNGEIAEDYVEISQLYTRLGMNFLVWDYRGYGQSDGEPTASALLTDSVLCFKATSDLLKNRGLNPSSVWVMGRSLGSAAACEIASNSESSDSIDGLIIESGFSDTFGLLNRIGISIQGDEAEEGFDNAGKISKISVPTLIIHGENDVIIPVTDGKELYEKSGSDKKNLVTIPNAGHNDLMMVGMESYFSAIRTIIGF